MIQLKESRTAYIQAWHSYRPISNEIVGKIRIQVWDQVSHKVLPPVRKLIKSEIRKEFYDIT